MIEAGFADISEDPLCGREVIVIYASLVHVGKQVRLQSILNSEAQVKYRKANNPAFYRFLSASNG